MSNIRPSIEAPEQRLVVPKAKAPPICPIFCRVLILAITLFACFAISATWYSKGIMWAYDTSTSSIPIADCPGIAESFKLNDKDYTGPACSMSISYQFELAEMMVREGVTVPFGTKPQDALERCILPKDPEDAILCYSGDTCIRSCVTTADPNVPGSGGQPCPNPDSLSKDETEMDNNQQCNIFVSNEFSEQTACYKVQVASYCTESFTVTPSNILAIRGILFATIFIIVFWFTAECVLRSVDRGLRQEQANGKARMELELPSKRKYLRDQVVGRWEAEARDNYAATGADSTWGLTPANTYVGANSNYSQAGMSPMGSAYYESQDGKGSGYKSQLYSRDPRKRFESNAWRRRLVQYKSLGANKKKEFQNKQLVRTLLLNFFFLLLIICSQWCILYFSPQHLSSNQTVANAIVGVVSIWEATSWLDWLIFIDVMLDIFLFIFAVFIVKWPRQAVFARHIQDELKEAAKGRNSHSAIEDDGTPDAPTETTRDVTKVAEPLSLPVNYDGEQSPGRESVQTWEDGSEDTETIDFVLQQAMTRDVCLMIACHKSTMTVERFETFTETLRSAMMVFPPSHIFVCDNGPTMEPFDETQWATQQVHPDINYLYVPEGNKTFAFYWCNKFWIPFLQRNDRIPEFKYAVIIDDDVPLPPDLHIPHQLLDQNPEIRAVHFPITATTPSGKRPLLVACQDVEYKMAAVHKLFQAALARPLSCHGAIALWDRESMDEVFYEHDTVFNGEDLYMGLSLLRKRDDSKIISAAQAIVPTYAPDNWGMLFRQRVKSWDVTSHKKTFTYLLEIVNPAGWCHLASWVLKPYFLQELLTIILDWLRMFLLFGLLLRDWMSLALMSIIFTLLLYFMVLLFQLVVLRERKDLRASFCTFLMFPWYRLSSLLFRLGALCQNILVYSHERTGIKIGVREDEIRDIPPCPPHHEVDWFTIWSDQLPEVSTPSTVMHPQERQQRESHLSLPTTQAQ